MTILTTVDKNQFNGNGVTTSFPCTFKILEDSNAHAVRIDQYGNEYELTLDSDYSVSGAGGESGFTVSYPLSGSPLPTGEKLIIYRDLDATQTTDLRAQGPFNPEVIEDAFDKLTMLIQLIKRLSSSAVTEKLYDATVVDFKNRRGINAADPINDQDVVTKAYLIEIAALISDNALAIDPTIWTGVTDGVNSTFSLSPSPTVSRNSSYVVALDGILQSPDTHFDISVSDATITFDSVPPAGMFYSIVGFGYSKQYSEFPYHNHDTIYAHIDDGVPIGAVMHFAGSVAPNDNWLVCDGSAVSRTTYADLFAYIGTTFGSGDGSTTFNLPNMQRRVLVGSGGSGTGVLGSSVGDSGGSETHTLIESEMPAHTHSAQPGFTVSAGGKFGAGIGSTGPTVSTGSTGGGGAHNNMQPSMVMLACIKALDSTETMVTNGVDSWSGATIATLQDAINQTDRGNNTQTGTAYSLVLNDAGKTVEMNNASANTLTVPPNSSVAFDIGTVINVCQYGAGVTTIAAGAGVTIRSARGLLDVGSQYAIVTLRKRDTDEWVLVGDLA